MAKLVAVEGAVNQWGCVWARSSQNAVKVNGANALCVGDVSTTPCKPPGYEGPPVPYVITPAGASMITRSQGKQLALLGTMTQGIDTVPIVSQGPNSIVSSG